MTNRRQFLGAAAVAAGLFPISTDGSRPVEPADDYVDAERWGHEFTKEFKGVRYQPEDLRAFGSAVTPFVTIEAGYAHCESDLYVEFREEHRDKPDTVTSVAFYSRFVEDEDDLQLSTHSEVDVRTARELAHIILEETEPVGKDE